MGVHPISDTPTWASDMFSSGKSRKVNSMTHQCCTLEVESRAMEAKQTVLLICLFRLTPIMELTPVCIHLLLQYCFVSEYTDALKQKTRCFTVTAISTYFLLTSSWCYPHHHDCPGVSLCTAQISQKFWGIVEIPGEAVHLVASFVATAARALSWRCHKENHLRQQCRPC